MWNLSSVAYVLLFFSPAVLVAAQGSADRKWLTLRGDRPLVIARGGYSGLFADSSQSAYGHANQTGLDNWHAWCDVQLTKDGTGICLPDINLKNTTNLAFDENPSDLHTYAVNGVQMTGIFTVDLTFEEFANVNLIQRIYSRPPHFDAFEWKVLTVDDMVGIYKPPGLWLSVPYDTFYQQHNLNMSKFILSASERMVVDYISSPEVDFLRNIGSKLKTNSTKLVLQFLGPSHREPTTNQTYGELLRNLKFIKTFAYGILVPKSYIYPVDASGQYLQNVTSLVQDAHIVGLEVFASDFVNDGFPPIYDYNYDPVAEYLNFVDNGAFSVDGVLTDFISTASSAIDCFSQIGKDATIQANLTVISNEGASGVYPGCTDMAYKQAVSDGVEILDCPVQMTKDGVPFCLGSINVRDRTNVNDTDLSHLGRNNAGLNITNGVFAYNLTWSQIQSLRPVIYDPYVPFALFRNPRNRNSGNFMQLSEFLAFANNASVSGVLLGVENANYLAQNQKLDVITAVANAVNKFRDNYTSVKPKKIMIKSTDSAVLSKFKSLGNYDLVYIIEEEITDILNSTVLAIKEYASTVIVAKRTVFPIFNAYLTNEISTVVPKLQAFGLQVYVQVFRNEFVSQAWDYCSDSTMELNQFYSYVGVNGVITDFPATAARFKRNRCLGYKSEDIPNYMLPVLPGGLIPQYLLSQAPASAPALTS